MSIDKFNPVYSADSFHTVVTPFANSFVEGSTLLIAIKDTLLACGWALVQTFPGRGVTLGNTFPVYQPQQPGETITPKPASCSSASWKQGGVGSSIYHFYDPLREFPGDCGSSAIWVPEGLTPGGSAANLATTLASVYGGTVSVGAGPTSDSFYFFFDDVFGIDKCDIGTFSDHALPQLYGAPGGYFNPIHPALGAVTVQGYGYELVSADGLLYIKLAYLADGVNLPNETGGFFNSMSCCLQARSNTGTYGNWLYPFSNSPGVYHVHGGSNQLIIWAEGLAGPAGRPTNIIVSALSVPNDVPAFVGANLLSACVMFGSLVSDDGSWFDGDANPYPAQVRDRLYYTKGVVQDLFSFVEGEHYSQSNTSQQITQSGTPMFALRGFPGFDLLATNGSPLAQNPWLMVPVDLYTAPSWIVGKLWDAVILSAHSSTVEGQMRLNGKKWRLVSSQFLGTGDRALNASLWVTAMHDPSLVLP